MLRRYQTFGGSHLSRHQHASAFPVGPPQVSVGEATLAAPSQASEHFDSVLNVVLDTSDIDDERIYVLSHNKKDSARLLF